MITFDAVYKSFGDNVAVSDVSFQAHDREILVLLGPSGCGKTTTLKMINRLIEPDAGLLAIDGKDITQEQPEMLRRRIGYVMQHAGLFPHYNVEENIAVVPGLLGWDKRRTRQRTEILLEKLHLPTDVLKRYPHELSGGQKQRVGIARALVADTPVLLMDEPFGALDNITKSNIHAEFKALDELKQKTIVMVTHDIEEAFDLADRICLMKEGRIVQAGTPKEMLYAPVNDFVRQFFNRSRLLLEHKVVLLEDVRRFLPHPEMVLQALGLPWNTSVWAALEKLNAAATSPDHYDQLVQAFSAFRKTQVSQ